MSGFNPGVLQSTDTTPTTSSRVATSHNSLPQRTVQRCDEVRCTGMEQLAFLKALKRLKVLTGTTEHLKGVKALRSSWVPGTLCAQLAKPAGCPSVQPLCSAPLCQTTCSKILAQTEDTIATVKNKQVLCSRKM